MKDLQYIQADVNAGTSPSCIGNELAESYREGDPRRLSTTVRWDKWSIVGLVVTIIFVVSVSKGPHNLQRSGVNDDDVNFTNNDVTNIASTPTLTIPEMIILCPKGASTFDPTLLPDELLLAKADFGAIVAADGVKQVDPYSCSPQNLSLLWLAANPPRESLFNAILGRYVLATLYFSLNGWSWHQNQYWLSDEDVCSWEGITCNEFDEVVKLSLTHNNLKGALPDDIRHLSSLQVLNLDQNTVTGMFPSEVVNLPELVELDLSLNHFTGTLPAAMWELTGMKIMDLTSFGGSLGSIPSEIGKLTSLERFLASGTKAKGILPTELGLCRSLKFLNLSRNQHEPSIPTQLGNLHGLQTLYLSGNTFDDVPDEVCSLMASGKLLAFDMKSKC